MNIRNFLSFTLLMTSQLPLAQAIEWSSIIKSADYEIMVDIDSYKVSAGKPYMTTKTVFKSPQTYLANPKSVQYLTRLDKTQFDCKEPQFRQLSVELLDASEKVLYTDKQANHYQPIPYGSDTFSVGQLTCQVHQMLGSR